ncbi:MAG: MFS transporter [Candidatus Bathyarchaeia archaeon]
MGSSNKNAKAGVRNVLSLGFVSMLNDASSEMIFPLLPLFLVQILGASGFIVGVVEGIAESTSSLLRTPAGYLSDKIKRRKPFLTIGYGSSAVSKTLLGFSTIWQHVLALQFFNRVGKGVRTSPRDALISESIPSEVRGRYFGLHRAMDTLGAILGPLIAFILLPRLANSYTSLFVVAGILSLFTLVLIQVLIRESATRQSSERRGVRFTLRPFSQRFKLFLLISGTFTLGNFSYAFLILRAQEVGIATGLIILLYLAYTITYALGAYPAGALSDKIGKVFVIAAGYLAFGLMCVGFALVRTDILWIMGLFILYGTFYALADGTQRALVADFSPSELRATGLGFFHTTVGFTALASNFIAGALWTYLGPITTFYFGAVLSFISASLLLIGFPMDK